ncbi:hypothetical protein, partial [uncultured Bacteroides sp.]
NAQKLGIMELHRFFRYAIEKMCKEKKSLNHFIIIIYITMIHIGQLIESELHRQERSVSWFAQKLCCERTNVYSIFKRKSIDTALLIRICQILHYDFFAVYSLKLEIKDQVATNPVQ